MLVFRSLLNFVHFLKIRLFNERQIKGSVENPQFCTSNEAAITCRQDALEKCLNLYCDLVLSFYFKLKLKIGEVFGFT